MKAFVIAALSWFVAVGAAMAEPLDAPLPATISAVWDIAKAERVSTPTRERICINGLWHWQPAQRGGDEAEQVPAEGWGYFKVPGCWPGITDYMQKDCQTVWPHPNWADRKLGEAMAAWYQRRITIPAGWTGRRIALTADYVNSYAAVFVDGRKQGELRFPGGELDLTAACRPGQQYELSLLVIAMPLKGVMLSYSDTASAKEVKGRVERRGLCGDVYLLATPASTRVEDMRVETSVRRWEITFDAALRDLAADGQYSLRASISENEGGDVVAEFKSQPFNASDAAKNGGRFRFAADWKPPRLWDLHTPQNVYTVSVSLLEAPRGKVLDSYFPQGFGFRELWIDGRDFFLNGSRVWLSAVPLDNAQVGAAWANYAAARESLRRLKTFGINFVYTHNYDCQPGAHLSFEEILRAADDEGVLVALTQPHFSNYDWKASDADANNGYAGHAAFYARVARNHPSAVFYSMSHNATGYEQDMNPDLIDGVHDPRDTWSANNAKLALRAEAIVHKLDPSRIVYHHASGNLGVMHTVNFYANFAPAQELSDWFEHWATQGTKPLFPCEYGAPFTWDWTMYRGWYKGQREFGGARVPWGFCLAEWNAQFLGDRAFKIGEEEKANLRWEAKQFRAGNLWHRWDYPFQVGSTRFEQRYPVFAQCLTDNWRAFRTWGVSAISPWEYEVFWKLRDGVKKDRVALKVDWENLQRPGLSADYIEQRYERMDMAFAQSDWIATPAAEALVRNNQPVLAYIAGKPGAFTTKDHNFCPGQTVEKQLVVINNSRAPVACDCQWSLALPNEPIGGGKKFTIETGQQLRIPLRFDVPARLQPGRYELKARVVFDGGRPAQSDSFEIDLLPAPEAPQVAGKLALFDPVGQTAAWLDRLGITCTRINTSADLSAYDTLIIGKRALTVAGPAPDVTRVRDGLKVIVFEQSSEVLEKRLGFRVAEYGLRRVFRRIPDHPLLAGIADEHLHDWVGEATLVPPRLKYELRPRYGPTVQWCDIPVTQIWRCGNRGNVASVLIEKPSCGDFRPVLDGGYSLQYSPLMEYREGRGLVLFCQLDVIGRTEDDPVAQTLARRIIEYVSNWKPGPQRKAIYVGDAAGKSHLQHCGFEVQDYGGGAIGAAEVLIAGPGSATRLSQQSAAIADWLKAGGNLLALGLDEREVNAFLPFRITTRQAEHISAWFDASNQHPLLAGMSPADTHNRDPREIPLIAGGAAIVGDGVLAKAENSNVVFCQMPPWQVAPEGVDSATENRRRTFRRASFLVTRLAANMGVAASTPLLGRFGRPVPADHPEQRWLDGLYLDHPQEWDDPYRFFRW